MARADSERRSASVVGTAIQAVVLLLLLAMLGAVVMVLLLMSSVVRVPNQVGTGVAAQAGRALSDAQQALQSATDPNHPPVGLTPDTELSALAVWHVGEGLPGGTDYVITVQSIKRRDGADSPDTGLFAVLHAELRQPRLTRILGQIVRSDSDPHDYAIYKGEVFRIGRVVYRVNWISQDESAVAAGAVRRPDAVTQSLKFEYD
jgi:type II secretory pathway pseudopilin PulG